MAANQVNSPFENVMVWTGRVVIVLLVWLVIAGVLNFVVMPIYTRQGTEIRVPDVRGMSLSEARREFGRRGFKLVVDDERYDAGRPPGMILEQFPAPGNWTKRGRRIHLAVSAGTATAMVPEVIGISREDAVFKLQAVGLKVAEIYYAFNDTTYEGLVVAQTPEADAVVDKLSPATITVSLGPTPSRFVVPDVQNLPEEQATYLILKAGLVVGDVEYDRYQGRRRGAVMIQEPPAGTGVAQGDTVRLTVNR
jgi:serine/threonine-protein kinase